MEKDHNSRLGILGGTFDPVHTGHLRIAEEICYELELEKVYLIPGSVPPHRDPKPIASFEDRLAMVKIAVQYSPHLGVMDLEGRRGGISYTIETLKELHSTMGPDPDIFFVIGMDAFWDIRSWKNYKDLFSYTNFVVIERPGYPYNEFEQFLTSLDVGFQKENENNYKSNRDSLLMLKKATLLDISSTKIRELAGDGKSIRFLLPDSVIEYIIEKGLYGIHEGI